ncbi:MAG: DUF6508 domain-containing protein [Sumerlaeia bacterium]
MEDEPATYDDPRWPELPALTPEAVAELETFARHFQGAGGNLYEEPSQLARDAVSAGWFPPPPPTPRDALARFLKRIYALEIMSDFPWPDWLKTIPERWRDDPAALDDIGDATTLRRLLIAHVRGDRFCDGHLWSIVQSGYLGKLVERLAETARRELG